MSNRSIHASGQRDQLVSPRAAVYLALAVLVTGAAFATCLTNDFVTWDDDVNFLENRYYRGLSPSHLEWMFTTFHMGPYQPLTWVTLGADYVVWGMNPMGYHLTSLVLHLLGTALFFLMVLAVMRRIPACATLSRTHGGMFACLLGTLAFAAHPLRVESVAWTTERRDVLSGVFYLAAALAYLRSGAAGGRVRPRVLYVAALTAYLLALLSKATGVALPLVFMFVDTWLSPRGEALRPKLAASLRRQVPFLALSFVFGVLALKGQSEEATLYTLAQHGPLARVMQAAYGTCFYVWKSVVPVGLSPLYLRDDPFEPLALKYLVCLCLAMLATIAVVAVARYRRGPAVAWFSYLLLAAPVLGFAQAGVQIAADRYTYLATMPFAVGLAVMLASRRGTGILPVSLPRRLAVVSLLALTAAMAVQTHRQTRIWHDTASLWGHALRLDPDHHLAYNNRGTYYESIGLPNLAMQDYENAIRAKPDYAASYSNRGTLKDGLGDIDGSLADYNRAIALNPKSAARIYNNRANIYQQTGQADLALADYATAEKLNPDFWELYANRGILRLNRGEFAAAAEDYANVIRLKPEDVTPHINRGFANLRLGRWEPALRDLNAAIALDPRVPVVYLNRGIVYRQLGNTATAKADFKRALSLAPPAWHYRTETEQYLRELGTMP